MSDHGQHKTPEKRILLFDEDYESMRDLKDHIEDEEGWYVELSAQEELLERLGRERFDLIVVDLMIHPISFDADGKEVTNVHYEGVNWKQTGLEFIRRLRKGEYSQASGEGTPPDVPIIVLSAVADQSTEEKIKEAVYPAGAATPPVQSTGPVQKTGAEGRLPSYIQKPFRLQEMVERIRSLLAVGTPAVGTPAVGTPAVGTPAVSKPAE